MASPKQTITIEWLFPDSHLNMGERGHKLFLDQALPEARSITTPLTARPYFADHDDVDLIILGPSNMADQRKALERLRPLRERIRNLIERGNHFLVTGNSLEIFGQSIHDVDGSVQTGLGIFDFTTKRDRHSRLTCFVLATHDDLMLTAYKAQSSEIFSQVKTPFVHVLRGFGDNQKSNIEGVHDKNFIGTELLGPLLILNPLFSKRWLRDLSGAAQIDLPFETNLLTAYERRLQDFKNERIVRNV